MPWAAAELATPHAVCRVNGGVAIDAGRWHAAGELAAGRRGWHYAAAASVHSLLLPARCGLCCLICGKFRPPEEDDDLEGSSCVASLSLRHTCVRGSCYSSCAVDTYITFSRRNSTLVCTHACATLYSSARRERYLLRDTHTSKRYLARSLSVSITLRPRALRLAYRRGRGRHCLGFSFFLFLLLLLFLPLVLVR